MKPDDEDNFDKLLRAHFERGAENQLGRAEKVFMTQFAADAYRARRMRLLLWIIGSSLSAAAVVLIALHWPGAKLPAPNDGSIAKVETTSSPASDEQDIEYTTVQQTFDDGVVYLDDDTSARQLRTQELEQVTWLDDDGESQLQMTIPRELVLFVECEILNPISGLTQGEKSCDISYPYWR